MTTQTHVITFTVNGEPVETSEKELTVREILVLAKLDPETHYLVEKKGEGQEIDRRGVVSDGERDGARDILLGGLVGDG